MTEGVSAKEKEGRSMEASATDWELLQRMRGGDDSAFEVLFWRYHQRVIRRASRWLPPDLAREVCHEVLGRLYRNPPEVLSHNSLGPWLLRVTRNLAVDRLRRRAFEVPSPDVGSDIHSVVEDPLAALVARNDATVLRGIVEELPQEFRQVVILRIDQDLPFREVAQKCGIPLGTALWRMGRALELLRERWRKINCQ